jgi:4-hydroxy-3-methylbut-2-enyl diphosphate reductase
MSRSAAREIQVSGVRVQRGEVLVPTKIGDPVYGMLACPAAPLVAGSLQARGHRVRPVELPRSDDDGVFDALLYLVTCPQQDGSTAAIAAAVAPADGLAAAAARAVVDEWATVAGSRSLLAASSPWCSGALGAASVARQTAAQYRDAGQTVHVLNPQAMPAETAAELATMGAVISASLAEAETGDVVVLPAHGVPPEVRAEAAQRGVTLVDATCPIIAGAQDTARRVADRGHHLVLIGQRGHPATAGIASQAAGHVTVLETTGGASALRVTDNRPVSYLMQPGVPVEATAAVASALRSRFPAVRSTPPGEICYAPSDRAGTIHAVATGSDLVLVLGDPRSPDARQVCGQARDAGARAQIIADVADIRAEMLASVYTIGLAESTSVPAGLAARVISALSGLGRLAVARRQLSTDPVETSQTPESAPAAAPGAGRAATETASSGVRA